MTPDPFDVFVRTHLDRQHLAGSRAGASARCDDEALADLSSSAIDTSNAPLPGVRPRIRHSRGVCAMRCQTPSSATGAHRSPVRAHSRRSPPSSPRVRSRPGIPQGASRAEPAGAADLPRNSGSGRRARPSGSLRRTCTRTSRSRHRGCPEGAPSRSTRSSVEARASPVPPVSHSSDAAAAHAPMPAGADGRGTRAIAAGAGPATVRSLAQSRNFHEDAPSRCRIRVPSRAAGSKFAAFTATIVPRRSLRYA